MLIFVSDLHLSESPDQSTIDSERFIRRIDNIVDEASRINRIGLVLLGDIFETLKSTQWITQGIRPWESETPKHTDTIESIVAMIVKSNAAFFDGLRGISRRRGIEITYVPGNHDRPINMRMGAKARAVLRRELPLSGKPDDVFGPSFTEPAYCVRALHGHEWDPDNRYDDGQAALGDAIVIELLVRLPLLVGQRLGVPENDPMLSFLWELDNIRPQNPRDMAEWILTGLDALAHLPDAGKAIQEAFLEIARLFKGLFQSASFGGSAKSRWWVKFLLSVGGQVGKRLGTLQMAQILPHGGSEDRETYRHSVEAFLKATPEDGTRYLLCGHTHIPEVIPLHSTRRPIVFLNTGTWRRVRQRVEGLRVYAQAEQFVSSDVESTVQLFTGTEQRLGYPPYEFRSIRRGNAI